MSNVAEIINTIRQMNADDIRRVDRAIRAERQRRWNNRTIPFVPLEQRFEALRDVSRQIIGEDCFSTRERTDNLVWLRYLVMTQLLTESYRLIDIVDITKFHHSTIINARDTVKDFINNPEVMKPVFRQLYEQFIQKI